MEIIKPNTSMSPIDRRKNRTGGITVFLAGSIEMGAAENWQDKFAKEFKDFNITFLNPRRDDWDSTWKQSVDDKNFAEQVGWELYGLEACDYVVMYFDPNTKSPISLLELGLHAHDHKLYVCCPDGFYRQGNVEIVCKYYGIPFYRSFDEYMVHLRIIWKEKLNMKP